MTIIHENIELLNNVTITGSGKKVKIGGRYIFRLTSADYNGATVTLQMLGLDGAIWIDLANGVFTVDAAVQIDLPVGGTFRVEITIATPGSGVYADLTRVPE